MISNIVFTKNRPLQLEAYLRSLYRYFPQELIKTYIIYKAELFESEYHLLFSRYPQAVVVNESDFHSDLMKLIDQVSTKYILFGIDDVVYFDSVDFDVIESAFIEGGDEVFGFSLRFSPESMAQSGDEIIEVEAAGQKVYKLNWPDGKNANTRYPFELCATIYRSKLVKEILNKATCNNNAVKRLLGPQSFLVKVLGKKGLGRKLLKSFGYFFSPNTLESWCCRWSQRHSEQLPGFIFFQKQCASAIQVNMVNTSTKPLFEGSSEFTVESLNEKFRQGYRLDIDFISKMRPNTPAVGPELFQLDCREHQSVTKD